MNKLEDILKKIKPLKQDSLKEGQDICDQLAKPIGALGQMETIYAKLYAMFHGAIRLDKKVVMVYVADNGIVEEKVSANPQETTFIVAQNMLKGQAAIAILAKQYQADLSVIDIGCKKDIYANRSDKVALGTKNMLQEAAMTREQAIEAILIGYQKTVDLIEKGYRLFGTGEMGIGNTTSSAALISVLLGESPQVVTGYGAGLTQPMKAHKTEVIAKSIERHAPYGDTLDIVAKLGGFDILGMVGTYLACAQYQLPCVIDGLISATGLLVASRLNEAVLDYAFASHVSLEPGYQLIQESLDLQPMLMMRMRLGEGVGCPLAFSLMESSVHTIEQMPRFEDSELKKTDYIAIRPEKGE